ncbi:MMPL family transporter [Photobacterium leiognathi]|uniref:MMPL family transporter n=1 Tax=Photobacterium leiognathi TaxID=553611 RepID=UPI0029816D77|nr:MMPL family transporter [Photobacterium leiognathi]
MFSNSKLASLWLAIMLILVAALGYQLTARKQLPIETNILALLPENRQDPIAQQAFDHIATSMSDKVIFVVGSKDSDTMLKAAKDFSQALPSLDMFSHIDAEVSQDQQQAWAKLYYPKRFQLLTPEQQNRLQHHPEQQTQNVIHTLYNPFSGITGTELKNDPFLLFREYLADLTTKTGKFSLKQGFLTTEYQGTHYALITANLKGSAYNIGLQGKLPALTALEQQIESKYSLTDSPFEIEQTGVIFYAAHGTQSAENEISTIGLGSLLGIVILLIAVYRSTLPLALALLSISCGLVAAFVTTVAIFGKVHLFSLVFGASLIGVSIDYAFHYLTDRLAAGKDWNAQQGLKHIFTAITLGLITSLIGYLGMLVAPFPGLQQLSLFSAIGLTAAYATVVCWYPTLAAKPSKPRAIPFAGTLGRWLHLWQQPSIRWVTPILLALLSIYGLTKATYNDDIRQLQALPASLQQQEATIKAITGVSSSQQMLLVKADSKQALLNKIAATDHALDGLIKQGALKSYQSLGQYIPTLEQQKANFELVKQLYKEQGTALSQSLNLAQPISFTATFEPLTMAHFLASPISAPLRFMWLDALKDKNGVSKYSAVILLHDIKQQNAIEQLTHNNSELTYLNKADEISALFGQYREHVTWLLIAATFAIYLLLAWRYGLKQGVKMIAPSLIAGMAGIAITSLTGTPLNLFNLLALILILGIGIDYSLFFAELKAETAHQQGITTLLAITLSALTTVLSFGLLALSETQAIHSFGITVLTGIIIAWLLAPLAMSKVKPSQQHQ